MIKKLIILWVIAFVIILVIVTVQTVRQSRPGKHVPDYTLTHTNQSLPLDTSPARFPAR